MAVPDYKSMAPCSQIVIDSRDVSARVDPSDGSADGVGRINRNEVVPAEYKPIALPAGRNVSSHDVTAGIDVIGKGGGCTRKVDRQEGYVFIFAVVGSRHLAYAQHKAQHQQVRCPVWSHVALILW